MKSGTTTKQSPDQPKPLNAEQKLLWRQAFLRSFRSWQTWAAFIILGVCAGLAAGMGAKISSSAYVAGILGAIGGAIGGFLCGHIVCRRVAPYWREELKSLGRMSGKDDRK